VSHVPAPRDDEQLFERFRRHGDLPALGELFERVAPAVLRTALHLSRDPATAEDLLQATFLRAIEARDDWDGARPLLPWLCGILQNRARHERWHAGRTPDAARLPPAPVADPAAAAVQAEFDAAVDAAIADLPEVYRPVLRLHLAYGQSPAAIAHALDRPPATVRSQLARGLEQLRRVLPAGLAGMAALAWTAERGLAAVKHAVLVKAQVAVPVVAAGTVVGGVLTMKKLVSVAAAALVAAGLWFVWPRPDAGMPGAPPNASGAVLVVANVAPTASSGAADASPQPTREPVAATPAATTGTLRITCRFADDGTPARGVGVAVNERGHRDSAMLARTGRTDDDGVVTFPQLAPATWRLAADRGGTALAEVAAGGTADVEIVIPKGILVRGRVIDEHDVAIAGASVWLSRGKHDYCFGGEATTSDAAGRFVLRSVETERFVSASSPGRRTAVVQPVRSENGQSLDVDLVLAGAGASLVGIVLDADGKPCASARVFVGDSQMHMRWSKSQFAEVRPEADTRTDANGAFAVHGLPGGVTQPVWIRAPDHCVWFQRVAIPGEGAQVKVALQRGATLCGRVTDASGRGLAEASVDYVSSAWYPGLWFDDYRGPEWVARGVLADADGNYHVPCISPGNLRVRSRCDQLEGETRLTVANDETATWNPVLIEQVIRGRVVDARGAPLANVGVTAQPPRGKGNMGTATSDADGKFVCTTLASVPHVLTFHLTFPKSQGEERVHATTLFGVTPSAEELVVRIPDAAFAVGTLRGRWLDIDGSPLKARVACSAAGQRHERGTATEPATGAFVLGPLLAGKWRVQASIETDGMCSRRSAWSEPIELRAGEVHDLGVLQMPATGWIDVTATGPDDQPLHDHSIVLEVSTGWSEQPWLAAKLERGQARIPDVAPGDYRVRLGGGKGLATHYVPASVRAGSGTPVTVRVPKGVGVELVLTPITEPVPMHLDFVWTRDGELFQRYDNWWEGNGERKWQQRMVPGAYELTVTSETGKRAVNHFTIGANEPDGRKIAIQLP
jgi:RNA polymerase sigma-70 factor, ECF subfamily